VIILSSLGTNNYREAHYKSEHHDEVITTGLFAVALHKWHPEAKVKILATEAAKRSGTGVYIRKHHPELELVEIPEGKTEAEAWALFEKIADPEVLPPGERVIFDITHGLRSLPMLGFLALSYLRVVRDIKVEKVYYGALDLTPREGDKPLTPVVDLTPLVNLLDWAQAANRFKDTGDASLFSPLIREKSAASLNSVADKLRGLSGALASNRTIEAAEQARELLNKLEESRQTQILARHRPFLEVVERIEEAVRPLQSGNEARLDLLAHHAQIQWYLQRGHYVQAVGLAREWLVSVVTWHQTGEIQLGRGKRSAAEDALGEHAKSPQKAESHLQEAAALWDKLSTLRNDLSHFGMRPTSDRTKSTRVEQQVRKTIESLPAAVRPLGLELDTEGGWRP
jgi:CRISPR-associated DxTHG motif protein